MRTSALFVLTAIVATLSSIGGIAAAAQADVTPVARDLLAEALRARQMADAGKEFLRSEYCIFRKG